MSTYRLSFTATPADPASIPEQRREPGRNGAPDSPIRADFPDGGHGAAEYVHAWHIWRQQMADGVLTRAERAVRAALYADLFRVPYDVAEFSTLGQLRILDQMAPADRALIVAALHREEAP